MTVINTPIIIRPVDAEDELALARLAALDSAEVPTAPLLVAEVHGELKVAMSLADGKTIADPFTPTGDLVALLRGRVRHSRARLRRRRPRAVSELWLGARLRSGQRIAA